MGRVEESAEVSYLEPDDRGAAVVRLGSPWIGDGGPLDAAFRRSLGGGLAFDRRTNVLWDEDAVQVFWAKTPEDDEDGQDEVDVVVALRSRVLVRERFPGLQCLPELSHLCLPELSHLPEMAGP